MEARQKRDRRRGSKPPAPVAQRERKEENQCRRSSSPIRSRLSTADPPRAALPLPPRSQGRGCPAVPLTSSSDRLLPSGRACLVPTRRPSCLRTIPSLPIRCPPIRPQPHPLRLSHAHQPSEICLRRRTRPSGQLRNLRGRPPRLRIPPMPPEPAVHPVDSTAPHSDRSPAPRSFVAPHDPAGDDPLPEHLEHAPAHEEHHLHGLRLRIPAPELRSRHPRSAAIAVRSLRDSGHPIDLTTAHPPSPRSLPASPSADAPLMSPSVS